MGRKTRARLFCPYLPDDTRQSMESWAELEVQLGKTIDTARKAWPGVTLGEELFLPYLAQRFPHEAKDAGKAFAGLRLEDLYLACACLHGAPEALVAFERAFYPEIERSLAMIKCPADLISEAKQNLRKRLFVQEGSEAPKIVQYWGRGDLQGWIRVAAIREARCITRKVKREVAADDQMLANIPSPDEDQALSHLKQIYRVEFRESFAVALRSLDSRDRNILRYHYMDGLNIDRIGLIYGVHRATIARWLGGIRQKLLESTRQEMMKKLRISEGEFESIMHLIASRLEVSIQVHLDPDLDRS
jgi:RNA polymerase sigma-70 factor, ECF subfamily